MFPTIVAWLDAHPVLRGALWMIAIAVAGTFVNWVTYKRSDAEWELYQIAYPHRAMLIRVCRAIFPHLRKIPQLAAFFPPDDPGMSNRFERATPEAPPPRDRSHRWALALVAIVALTGCSWFKSDTKTPPPAQAAVLYAAKALDMINRECSAAAEKMRVRASTDADNASAIALIDKATTLATDCQKATVAGRSALEAVESLLETGVAVADGHLGCSLKRGLDSVSDVCTAMRAAKVIDRCPAYVDSVITFGSPLLSVVGACPLEAK